MKFEFFLFGNDACPWFHLDDVYFIGYFFDDADQLYRGLDAVAYIQEKLKTNSLVEVVQKMNGSFSVIVNQGETCLLAADSMNFYPLFYINEKNRYVISDRFEKLVELQGDFHLNTEAIDEFETAGFVLGTETLAKNIFKNNSSQVLKLSSANPEAVQYQDFLSTNFSTDSLADLSTQFEAEMLNAGQRLIKFLDGRTAVVPLSGGYDSRLIVALLKRLNYQKVICITYGTINPEVSISKKVAQTLGFEWFFVDYSTLNIEEIQSEKNYENYLHFAANGFSMPYLMEYFAVAQLLKDSRIPKDSVFIPGHSGDFLGGSYVLKTVKNHLELNQLPHFIASKYFIFVRKDRRKRMQIEKRISQSLQSIGHAKRIGNYNIAVEEWDVREKLAKFIFHSSQVFNFFGFEHYFLLWDQRLVKFFRKVPMQFREHKMLYDHVLEEKFFEPYHIHFQEKELKTGKLKVLLQQIKDRIRYFFPWKMVLNRINNADWPYYRELTKSMLKFVEKCNRAKFRDFKNYNAVICAWYVQFLKQRTKREQQ